MNIMNRLLARLDLRLVRQPNPKVKKSIFFMHLGKCGGSSVYQSIRTSLNYGFDGLVDTHATFAPAQKLYPGNFDRFLASSHEHRLQLAFSMMVKGTPFISGHIPFHPALFGDFKDRYVFITLVRDPVQRWLSSLRYRIATNRPLVPGGTIQDQFDSFLNSRVGQFEANTYRAFFGGFHNYVDFMNIDTQAAIDNTRYFDLLGFTDSIGYFYEQLGRIVGREIVPVLSNESNQKAKANKVSLDGFDEIAKQYHGDIARMCEADYRIFNFLKNNR